MSHKVILSVFLFGCSLQSYAQNETPKETETINKVTEIITRINNEVNAPLVDHFAMSQIMSEIRGAPSFGSLVSITTNNWETIVDNWERICVNDNSRLIQEHALLFLSPEAYLSCLPRILNLYEKGLTKKNELSMMFFRAENDKRWLLSANYKDARVISLLDEMARVFKDDRNMSELVKFYKRGDAKRRDEKIRNDNHEETRSQYSVPRLTPLSGDKQKAADTSEKLRRYGLFIGILLSVSVAVLCFLKRHNGK